MDNEEKKIVEKSLSVQNILWVALFAALFSCLGAGLYLKDHFRFNLGEDFPTQLLRNVIYLVSALQLIFAKFIKNKILFKGGNAFLINNALPPNQDDVQLAVFNYKRAVGVSTAMSEIVGVYGFILLILGKNVLDLYVLICLAAVAMFYYRPSREELINQVEKYKKSGG